MNKISRLFVTMVLLLAMAMPFAAAAKSIEIYSTPVTLSGNPGEAKTGEFTLGNTGDEIINIVYSSTALVSGTKTMTMPNIPASASVGIGDTRIVSFTINIPTGQSAGAYVSTITASDSIDPAIKDTIPVSLVVNEAPNMQINPTALTANVAAGYSGTSTLTVTNTGNIDLTTVGITFTDLTKAGGSEILSATNIAIPTGSNNFALAQGANKVVTLTINVPASNSLGTYTGTFSVVSGAVTKTGTLQVTVVQAVGHVVMPTTLEYTGLVKGQRYSKVFTITNDGNFDLAGIQITSNADPKYAVTFTNVPATIAKTQSRQVTVTFTVPDNEVMTLHEICIVHFASDKYSANASLKIQPTMMLSLKSLYVFVDGKRTKVTVGSTTQKIKIYPESKVEFRADVENLYTDDEDIAIEDVLMTVTLFKIDNDEDLEEESKSITVNTEETETLSTFFDIPLEIDDKTYKAEVTFEGQDENGGDQDITVNTTLSLEKEPEEVKIRTFDLSRETVKCDLTADMEVEIVNMGTRDEDEVMYTIKNSELGINIAQGSPSSYLELVSDPFDTDNRFSKRHSISLPATTKPGTYTLEMNLYRDRDELDDTKTVTLTVQKCTEDTTVTPTTTPVKPPVEVIVPPTTIPPTTGPVVAQEDSSLLFGLSEWAIIAILGGIFLVLLIVVVVLIATRR